MNVKPSSNTIANGIVKAVAILAAIYLALLFLYKFLSLAFYYEELSNNAFLLQPHVSLEP